MVIRRPFENASWAYDAGRAHGQRLGRPKARVPIERLQTVTTLSVDGAARTLGVSSSTLKRWRRTLCDVGSPVP